MAQSQLESEELLLESELPLQLESLELDELLPHELELLLDESLSHELDLLGVLLNQLDELLELLSSQLESRVGAGAAGTSRTTSRSTTRVVSWW